MWKLAQGTPRVLRGCIEKSAVRAVLTNANSGYENKGERNPQPPTSVTICSEILQKCIRKKQEKHEHHQHQESFFQQHVDWWHKMGMCDHIVEAMGLGAVLLFGGKLADYYKLRRDRLGEFLPSIGLNGSTISSMKPTNSGRINVGNLEERVKALQLGQPEETDDSVKKANESTSHKLLDQHKRNNNAGRTQSKLQDLTGEFSFSRFSDSLSSDSYSAGCESDHESAHRHPVEEFKFNLEQLCLQQEASKDNHRAVQSAADNNYSSALAHWEKAASKGSAKALFNLGLCYDKGKGVDKNIIKAMCYYRQAASKGNGRAAHNLALILMDSGEPSQNLYPLLEQACKRNIPSAYSLLGVLHIENGRTETACRMFEKAVELEDPDGYYFLAVCLEHGVGVEQNHQHALNMYTLAAQTGQEQAFKPLLQLIAKLTKTKEFSRDKVRSVKSTSSLTVFKTEEKPKLSPVKSCVHSFSVMPESLNSSGQSLSQTRTLSDVDSNQLEETVIYNEPFVEYEEVRRSGPAVKQTSRNVQFYLGTQDLFSSDDSDWDSLLTDSSSNDDMQLCSS